MKKEELTDRQCEVLKNIISFQDEHGYPPTVRELCEMSGVRSTSTISLHMNRLKELGYITWISTMPRTIQVLRESRGARNGKQ